MPIQLCIWTAQNNQENLFQFFLLLKLFYPNGKSKFTKIEMQALSQILGFTDRRYRQIKEYIKRLEELKWIRTNGNTGFYLIKSFENLRRENDWISRASVECTLKDLKQIYAFVGGAIFAYQFKDFWRKTKKGKSVRIMGRAYHFLFPSFNYHKSPAPIATTGIEQLYGIPKSKVSELKILAQKMGYLTFQHDFEMTNFTEKDINLMAKYTDSPQNFRRINEKFYLQLIDLVLPLISIKKRRNLGT
ncbi:MAG: hypothetical protein KJ941_02625 [Bacteroidetes bacterium]|nr:hypothetical protein [Bacteroidota bacterium]